jgi:hypothetical protein
MDLDYLIISGSDSGDPAASSALKPLLFAQVLPLAVDTKYPKSRNNPETP